MRHHHYLLLFVCMCCSLAATAQNKNSLHASIFYPFVAGDPVVFGKRGIGLDLGYQYSVSKNFSLGGDYRLTVRGNSWKGDMYCGNSIGTEIVNISFHDFDVKGRLCVNPINKWKTIVSMALGYSHSIFTLLGEEQTNERGGYNLTPSIELNRKISDHFSVYAHASYSYKHFTWFSIHDIDLGWDTRSLFKL